MIKVLIVGQTPPPLGGQAIMIGELLRMREPGVELIPIRMDFSEEMTEVGKLKPKKLLRLASLILKIMRARIATGASILYYPPGGSNLVPVIRDIIILLSTRWMFKRTVFHFHAGGLSEMYARLPAPLRPLYTLAYGRPDAAVRLSELNPEDGKFLRCRKEFIVPYGIEDPLPLIPGGLKRPPTGPDRPPRILFVALIRESKGILVLLEACRILAAQGVAFRADVMGKFEDAEIEKRVRVKIADDGLGDRIRFLGVLSGAAKFAAFAEADVFCFPTFFESETFGVVLLEAMALSLPLVATRWRGVPSLVREGENGFLVPIKDAEALAGKLRLQLEDPELRAAMGRKGRALFEAGYALSAYHRAMADVFRAIAP